MRITSINGDGIYQSQGVRAQGLMLIQMRFSVLKRSNPHVRFKNLCKMALAGKTADKGNFNKRNGGRSKQQFCIINFQFCNIGFERHIESFGKLMRKIIGGIIG